MMKKLFDNDKFLAILSLMIAVVLWMMVISQRNPQTDYMLRSIPITFLHETQMLENHDLNIISKSHTSVDVEITGRLSEVYDVLSSDVSVMADLSGIATTGAHDIPLKVEIAKAGVSVKSVSLENVRIVSDYIIKNRREIEIKYFNDLPEGLEIESTNLSVSSITIEGPQTALKQVAKAIAVIDLSEVKESKSVECDLQLVDSEENVVAQDGLSLSSTKATVDIKVLQSKEVPVQVVLDGEVNTEAQGITVVSHPTTVVVKGDVETMKGLEKIETEPISQLHIPSSTASVTALLNIPDNVKTETTSVRVEFQIDETVQENTES